MVPVTALGLLVATAVVLGAIIHRVTGMGFSLVSMPILVLAQGPHDGVRLVVLMSCLPSACLLAQRWRDVAVGRSLVLSAPSLVTIPLGIGVAARLEEPMLMLLIGLVLLATLLSSKVLGTLRLFRGRRGALVGGSLAGFCNATAGLAGPPLALHGASDGWEHRSFAASVQVVFLVLSGLTILLGGFPRSTTLPWGLLTALLLGGTAVGAVLARCTPPAHAHRAMMVIAWVGVVAAVAKGLHGMR